MPYIPTISSNPPRFTAEDIQHHEQQNASNAIIEWAMSNPTGRPPGYLLHKVQGYLNADDIIFGMKVGRTLASQSVEHE